MTAAAHLLPANATRFERAVALTADPLPRAEAQVNAIRGWKYRTPHAADLLPFLLDEYGLGPLLPYYDNPQAGLAPALRWQRLRGTPEALDRGLGFIGYGGAALEEAPARRRRWNLYQLGLTRLRDAEEPDLGRIEGIAGLSTAVRSKFWRGYHGYDVRAAEFSWSKTSQSLYSNHSGVKINGTGAWWSFGRDHDRDETLSPASLEALGVWSAASALAYKWAEATMTWRDADFTWASAIAAGRARMMAALIARMPCWVEFRGAGNAVIGYRRARTVARVMAAANGGLTVSGSNYTPAGGASTSVYVEALTGFGDGWDATAINARLRFGATPVLPENAGALWLAPGGLTMPLPPVASHAVSIPFGRTVRERLRFLLRTA